MRIVQVSTFPPMRCGIGDYTADLCGALVQTESDLTIDVFTYENGGSEIPWQRPHLTVHRLLSRGLRLRSLSQVLRRLQPDVVHVQMSTFLHPLGVYAGIRRHAKSPIVSTVHDVPEGWRLAYTFPAMRTLYEVASTNIVHSDSVADSLVVNHKVTRSKILKLPHGVDTHRFSPSARDATIRRKYGLAGGRLALFFGFLRPGKGLETLLRAWRVARPTDAELVIVGGIPSRPRRYNFLLQNEADYYGKLRLFASELNLRNLKFLGYVPAPDIPHLLSEADIIVLPYEKNFTQSGPLHKSMAAGKAILATDVPGFRALITSGNNGLLVPPGNEVAIADGLNLLLSDPDLRQRLGGAARQVCISQFDWSIVARRTLAVYKHSLMGRDRNSAG